MKRSKQRKKKTLFERVLTSCNTKWFKTSWWGIFIVCRYLLSQLYNWLLWYLPPIGMAYTNSQWYTCFRRFSYSRLVRIRYCSLTVAPMGTINLDKNKKLEGCCAFFSLVEWYYYYVFYLWIHGRKIRSFKRHWLII